MIPKKKKKRLFHTHPRGKIIGYRYDGPSSMYKRIVLNSTQSAVDIVKKLKEKLVQVEEVISKLKEKKKLKSRSCFHMEMVKFDC